jgi:predicted ATP-grasp superfamily ATP-dependent carboligase
VASGHKVITLDYFGDRDQKMLVQNYSLMRDFQLGFSVEALRQASCQLDFGAVVYISSLENHPDVVERLAQGHVLLGNSPDTLQQVRHWPTLRSFCHEAQIPFPATAFAGEALPKRGRWLRKPVNSGGGYRIAFWAGERLDRDHLLQEYIAGAHGSAAFVADGRECVLIGVTEQLIGQRELGAHGFTWCGNVLPLALSPRAWGPVLDALQDMTQKLTARFHLRGVNGLDFVMVHRRRRPVPVLVEVNPRYTASMELVEWAHGLSIFDLHLRSLRGELPAFSLSAQVDATSFYGKGIVYAREKAIMPETTGWRDKSRRDIPFPGEMIESRQPICTVLARGASRDECWEALRAGAGQVWREVEKPVRGREEDGSG